MVTVTMSPRLASTLSCSIECAAILHHSPLSAATPSYPVHHILPEHGPGRLGEPKILGFAAALRGTALPRSGSRSMRATAVARLLLEPGADRCQIWSGNSANTG